VTMIVCCQNLSSWDVTVGLISVFTSRATEHHEYLLTKFILLGSHPERTTKRTTGRHIP